MSEPEFDSIARLAIAADNLTDLLKLLCHPLVGRNDFVKRIGDFACQSDLFMWQAD